MRALHQFPTIHVHKAPVDGRKQINGLATIVQMEMKLDPFAEALFVFVSRRYDNVKLLYWNKSGFALWLYRLEQEKFRWPRKWTGDTISLSSEQLGWLLDGYDIMRMKPHASLDFHPFS